ncbi:MAG TPA: DUF5985 family protein [Gemmatimonadales bacterium]|nr:DUF5985 family protein [Gemmatimonadales bacterium]
MRAYTPVLPIISGAIVAGYTVAGLFFLRFWRETRDRLFAVFAVAFWTLGVQRLTLALLNDPPDEAVTGLYLLRLAAFVLILWAIFDKNRGGKR